MCLRWVRPKCLFDWRQTVIIGGCPWIKGKRGDRRICWCNVAKGTICRWSHGCLCVWLGWQLGWKCPVSWADIYKSRPKLFVLSQCQTNKAYATHWLVVTYIQPDELKQSNDYKVLNCRPACEMHQVGCHGTSAAPSRYINKLPLWVEPTSLFIPNLAAIYKRN